MFEESEPAEPTVVKNVLSCLPRLEGRDHLKQGLLSSSLCSLSLTVWALRLNQHDVYMYIYRPLETGKLQHTSCCELHFRNHLKLLAQVKKKLNRPYS